MEGLERRYVLDGTLSIANSGDTEGTEASGWTEIEFPITYSGTAVGIFTVPWEIKLTGTADAGDFPDTHMSGTVQFEGLADPGGETKKAVIRVWADRMVELSSESFQVELGEPSIDAVTTAVGTANGTITDNDSAEIQIHVSTTGALGPYSETFYTTASEGNSGTTKTFWVKFFLTNPIDVNVSFDYEFRPQWTDSDNNDYTASSSSGTVTFSALDYEYHDWLSPLTITYQGDDVVERDELIILDLTDLNAPNRSVSLASPNAMFNIDNDDTAFLTILTRNTSVGKLEGNPSPIPTFEFDVKVDKAVDVSFTVDVTTLASTAIGDEDYHWKRQTLTFNGGTANETKLFSVTGIGDTKLELDEVFYAEILNIIAASGRDVQVGNPSTAGATILNDDDQAKVSISGGSVMEGNTGTTQLPFTLTLDRPVDYDVVVTVDVWGTTATSTPGSEQDFVLPTGGQVAVTIPAGETSAGFNVTVLGDTRDETNETVVARIDSIDAGEFDVIADEQQDQDDGTIQDDD